MMTHVLANGSPKLLVLKSLPFQHVNQQKGKLKGNEGPKGQPTRGVATPFPQHSTRFFFVPKASGLPIHNLPHQPPSRGIACLRKASFASIPSYKGWKGDICKAQKEASTKGNSDLSFKGVMCWLVVSTQLKNISQNGNLCQIGMKIKSIWNHQLDVV